MQQNKAEQALACFDEGFNCAQAILSTYGAELGLTRETALHLALGLGAGMGRLQETCGAVTGAYLVVGLSYSKIFPDPEQAKEKTYAVVQEFDRLFRAKNQTTNCRELIGVDLRQGDRQIAQKQVKTVCPRLIQDAAEILEQLLS